MRSSGKVKGQSSILTEEGRRRGDQSPELLLQTLQSQLQTNVVPVVVIGGSLNIQTRAGVGVSSVLQRPRGGVTTREACWETLVHSERLDIFRSTLCSYIPAYLASRADEVGGTWEAFSAVDHFHFELPSFCLEPMNG